MKPVNEVILWLIVAGCIGVTLLVLYAVFAWAPGRESRKEETVRGWGKTLLRYSGNPCPACGRVRLEIYDNGKERCEKCAWCPQENRYVEDDELYQGEEDFRNA